MELIKFFLPAVCVLCHGPAKNNDLCNACSRDLPWLEHVCKRCALPLLSAQMQCGKCQHTPPYYTATVALFQYAEPIINMLSKFKFHQQLLYGNLFSHLLIEKLRAYYQNESLPELFIPVPLHASRLRERGYNQALELARPLAKAFKVKLNYVDLIRNRKTMQQSLITENQRQANVRGAFTLTKQLPIKHVALVDDVITTAYTINECSKILKSNGIEKITVLAIARTSLKS